MGKARKPAKKKRTHKTARPELSIREIRFCAAYALDPNATAAHKAAFPPTTDNTHANLGFRLLRKAKIRRYIRELQDEACEEAKVTVGYVVKGFKRACDADNTSIFDDDWALLPRSRWPEGVRLGVVNVKVKHLFENQPDPGDATKTVRVHVGFDVDVKGENKTECRKVLAQIKRMIGSDAEKSQSGTNVTIGGANPEVL